MHDRRLSIAASMLLASAVWIMVGCAHKAVVSETTTEPAVIAEQKEVAETDAEKETKDRALREADIREQERLRAEREQAQREQALKDRAAAEAAAMAKLAYIYFDFDKSELTEASRAILKQLADKFESTPNMALSIEGNCDERGTVEYNLALGQRRADAAKAYLISLGVDQGRISTISYGKEKPIDPGHTEEAWAKNRNDHFVISARK